MWVTCDSLKQSQMRVLAFKYFFFSSREMLASLWRSVSHQWNLHRKRELEQLWTSLQFYVAPPGLSWKLLNCSCDMSSPASCHVFFWRCEAALWVAKKKKIQPGWLFQGVKALMLLSVCKLHVGVSFNATQATLCESNCQSSFHTRVLLLRMELIKAPSWVQNILREISDYQQGCFLLVHTVCGTCVFFSCLHIEFLWALCFVPTGLKSSQPGEKSELPLGVCECCFPSRVYSWLLPSDAEKGSSHPRLP